MIGRGSVALFHLVQPTEKFWGVVLDLGVAGVCLRGLNLSSFEDWLRQAANGEGEGIAPATLFVPLHRVERISLDEPAGPVESHRQRVERRLGVPAEVALGCERRD